MTTVEWAGIVGDGTGAPFIAAVNMIAEHDVNINIQFSLDDQRRKGGN